MVPPLVLVEVTWPVVVPEALVVWVPDGPEALEV